MASLTVRNLDDQLKQRLRLRAAGNGRSMEDEVRVILATALGSNDGPALLDAIAVTRGDAPDVAIAQPSRADRDDPDID